MSKFHEPVDRHEAELVARESALDARELQLNRREAALVTLAGEVAAERERLVAAKADLLEELRRLDIRHRQATPRAFAAPAVAEATEQEDDWWAKVLGRKQPTA